MGSNPGGHDFYPRSPCGERRGCGQRSLFHRSDFYPRSPCGERRICDLHPLGDGLFLSTLSLRRATSNQPTTVICQSYFYPRSPCGERRAYRDLRCCRPQISIHALLAESDPGQNLINGIRLIISIHALLAESDSNESSKHTNNGNFYPRSPCGERLVDTLIFAGSMLFLSTLSLRRATTHPVTVFVCVIISIHALLAESDWPPVRDIIQWEDFYPRSPCGERQTSSR